MKTNSLPIILIAAATCLCCSANAGPAGRTTISLDGQWQITDSKSATAMPANFAHTVPVPGLAHLAKPPFPNVDRFLSREHLAKLISEGKAPRDWMTKYWNGKVEQDRNYFWYRKTFRAPAARAVAMLKINKAQFGTAVWLNGHPLAPQDDAWHGEYPGCFTASFWDLTKVVHWNAENTILVRIGAHPAVLPDVFPVGSDFEKTKWTPGIYDDVTVFFCDNPLIESVQVAPRIKTDEIVVQTELKNFSTASCSASLMFTVKTWKDGKGVATTKPGGISIGAGEDRFFTNTIKIPHAQLWSPGDPFLYVLKTRVVAQASSPAGSGAGGAAAVRDSVETRFGMREFHFDPATKRAYLNGKLIYLRGSNITLHRFFEDPLSGDLPWDDAWVRKLLATIPKKMHWNYFRFCIGPVPQHWLDVCDETGLLVQNEFPVWTGGANWYKDEGYFRAYDVAQMIRQYSDWMRDNWNHPSVVVWDANNETENAIFAQDIIPAVRGLDLSHRPWEDSYNPPVSPDDLEEYHAYLFHSGYRGRLKFNMADLEIMDGKPRPDALPSPVNAVVLNEYGWLWLNRDGTPTELTKNVYAQLAGINATDRQRLNLCAYLLAGLTEYWRAHRQFAGVCHFVYLTGDFPGAYTSDNFSDVVHLKLDPAFEDYVGQAFKPLGVYINFFEPTLQAGASHKFLVKMVNDYDKPMSGQLVLTLETRKGEVLAKTERPFEMDALGAGNFPVTLTAPKKPQGDLILKADAVPEKASGIGSTISRRWVSVVEGQ